MLCADSTGELLNTTSTNDGRKHVCCVILVIEIHKITDLGSNNRVRRLDKQYFLPDQSVLLRSIGHDAVKRVDAPTRNWWYQDVESPKLWSPMVALTTEFWVHGLWLTWIGDYDVLLTSPGLLEFSVESSKFKMN
ncbi:hypothetical protein PHMEG_0004612 [Phytophthora megakarya]|uniref:Uncharacterized protein n=1 Tax=Phytophthora megakarya TaxID=4795 RepID=A0A225WTG7_9STRA|nr:hypothetical protein PHMEG_0004612 [Phytophthora megakarya]